MQAFNIHYYDQTYIQAVNLLMSYGHLEELSKLLLPILFLLLFPFEAHFNVSSQEVAVLSLSTHTSSIDNLVTQKSV